MQPVGTPANGFTDPKSATTSGLITQIGRRRRSHSTGTDQWPSELRPSAGVDFGVPMPCDPVFRVTSCPAGTCRVQQESTHPRQTSTGPHCSWLLFVCCRGCIYHVFLIYFEVIAPEFGHINRFYEALFTLKISQKLQLVFIRL